MLHVLVVVQNDRIRRALLGSAPDRHCSWSSAGGVEEAAARLSERAPDLLLLGSRFHDGTPSELITQAYGQGVRHTVQVDEESLESCQSALNAGIRQLTARRAGEGRGDPDGLTHRDGVPIGVSIRHGSSLKDAKRRLILTTLAHFEGRRAPTASRLGMTVEELYEQLKEYGYWRVDPDETEASIAGGSSSNQG